MAAAACTAWALPISPPSMVAKEFNDMFWALNGATLSPRLAKIRQRAVVKTDLPALDMVPWTISTLAGRSPTCGSANAALQMRNIVPALQGRGVFVGVNH
ncbi:MAG: hypothetical protein HW397_424 [Dehalococcoidia bacterium]|nr:hypothetical protein [Dehalococcoidia bacterium]